MNSLNLSVHKFSSSTGNESIYYKKISNQKSSKNLLIIHDFFDYHDRYLDFAKTLASDKNLDVYLLDLKGFGHSSGTRSHVAKFKEYLEDLDLFFEDVNSQNKFHLLGQGLGGLVLISYLIRKTPSNIGKCVFINPVLGMDYLLKDKVDTLIEKILYLTPYLKFPMNFSGSDMTHNFFSARGIDKDPLVSHYITCSLYLEIQKMVKEVRNKGYLIKQDSFFVLSDKDQYCDHKYSVFFAKMIEGKEGQYRIYKGLFHDILHENGSKQIKNDILSWL